MNTLKWYNEVIQLSSTDYKVHTCFDCWVLITALYQKAELTVCHSSQYCVC